jgi:multiple antibiotic resistance protein
MEQDSFILTIFFLTLGPIKIIAPFAKLTQPFPKKFKQEVAIKGTFMASIICFYVVVLGGNMLSHYRISLNALNIAAGVVLLISALETIFPRVRPTTPPLSNPTAIQLAISPVATPIIVPPIGIAAILIFVMISPGSPSMWFIIIKGIVIMLVLNFLVMFYIDRIIKLPIITIILQILGSVLVFLQVALAIETFLKAFRNLGIVN